MRSSPERLLLRRFLTEIRQHLVGDEVLLSLLPEAVHDAQRLAVDVVRDQHRHLRDMVADFELYSRLDAELVAADPGSVALMPWLQQELAMLQARAERLGTTLDIAVRSFVPDRVAMDVGLAARALQGVLDVAAQRVVAGPVQLQVSYQANADRLTGELVVDIATRGGGFTGIELGHVFQPFVVQDGASRSLLGLSIAHRLCALIGGALTVESPGRAYCGYRLTLEAPPERGAAWLDPGDGQRSLGPVRPARVLFVGAEADEPCRAALCGDAFVVEHAQRLEQVLVRLDRQPDRWGTIVVDARGEASTVDGFVHAMRRHGFTGVMLVCGATLAEPSSNDLCLATLTAESLLQVARRGRDA